MPTLVVIPEKSVSGQRVFESLIKKGEVPEIFPGWGSYPRGILGELEESPDVKNATPAGKIPVKLSNGEIRTIPEENVWIIE